ncbi:MAG: methyltransferase domain-containing protein [Acidobacteriota bacterium]
MKHTDSHYVHGTLPAEQARLLRLNELLNPASLEAMALEGGEKILDVGCGPGLLSRMMARKSGSSGCVVAIERERQQLDLALRLAREAGDEKLVDFRIGAAACLPLQETEWGTFDLAHARFLLEHVLNPAQVVSGMVRAIRPCGRLILEDDDHDLLRLWPEPRGFQDLWRAYYLTYEKHGKDPFVGRRLTHLIHKAGGRPRRILRLPFASCAGSPDFPIMAENFIAIVEGAREEILASRLVSGEEMDESLEAFREWQARPDAALWYSTAWAEGVRSA